MPKVESSPDGVDATFSIELRKVVFNSPSCHWVGLAANSPVVTLTVPGCVLDYQSLHFRFLL